MNASRAANRVEVTLGGKGVTSRAGLVVVAELADRLGLTKTMSSAMSPIVKRRRRRDPGVALAHVALLLADGGDCLSDLAVLRDEPDLFGVVASDSTALRALECGWAAEAIIDARRVAREAAWEAGAAPETVTLDIDATVQLRVAIARSGLAVDHARTWLTTRGITGLADEEGMLRYLQLLTGEGDGSEGWNAGR